MSLALRTPPPESDAAPAAAVLERARSVVESRFLAAGEALGASAEGVGQLIAALERLAAAVGGQTIEATSVEMQRAADALLGLPARHEERREQLRALARGGGQLTACIEDMRRDLAYLRVFAINIKVTAAPLSDSGEDFAVFAQELADRIEAGRVELEAFAAEVGTLDAQLAGAETHEQTLAAQCARVIPILPDALRAGAGEMAAHNGKVAQVTTEVTGLARDIQRKMGAALAALQVGDSTRQRIEHVQLGLAAPAARGAPPEARRQLTAAVARLLCAQLEAAGTDFARDSAELSRSMNGIAGAAADILKLGDVAFGRTAGGDALFERMTQGLAQAVGLVDDMEAADQAAAETGRAAAGQAAALNLRIDALQAIRRDVQHMALNAAIKCARIGELGRPLAVIAIELRAHAAQLETSANLALETLQALGEGSERLALGDRGVGAGEVLGSAAERVEAADAAARGEAAAASAQGQAVVSGLHEAVTKLDLQREIGGAMRDAAAALAADAACDPGPCDAEALAEVLDRIGRTYTMAQERETHAAVAAELGVVAAASPVAADAADDVKDVLF